MISDAFHLFTPFLQPIAFVWLLQVLGTVHLLWRRRIREALFPAGMAVLIWIIGGSPLATWLIASLERPYARAAGTEIPNADVVLMLGGCSRTSEFDLSGFDLQSNGDRVVTALGLVRLDKARALVLGGGTHKTNHGRVPEGQAFERWLTKWNLVSVPMFNLGLRDDTHDEAIHFQLLAKEHDWRSCLLVTSAWHMERSAAIFKKLGIPVTPVACDFEVIGLPHEAGQIKIIPGGQGFSLLGLYLHEKVGWLVYRVRGWV